MVLIIYICIWLECIPDEHPRAIKHVLQNLIEPVRLTAFLLLSLGDERRHIDNLNLKLVRDLWWAGGVVLLSATLRLNPLL